jgi:hypothetical protein
MSDEGYLTLGEKFCRALLNSLPNPEARTRLLMELAKWSGKTLYIPAVRRNKRRVQVARSLLENDRNAAEAALIIHERFGVTMRQAQRDVKQASDKSQGQ